MRENVGWVSFLVGGVVVWALANGYVSFPDRAMNDLVFVVAGLLVLGGGIELVLKSSWRAFRERNPTRERQQQISAEASRLGLRSLERDRSALDLSFPFLEPMPLTGPSILTFFAKILAGIAVAALAIIAAIAIVVLADPAAQGILFAATAVVVAAVGLAVSVRRRLTRRPKAGLAKSTAVTFTRGGLGARYERVFAGTWKALDVRVFDYSYVRDDVRDEWTCVLMPLASVVPDLEIARESVLTHLLSRLGQKDLITGEERFDRAFHIRAERELDVLSILDARVRSRLFEEAPSQALIQLHGQRMLYCCARLPIEDRAGLLDLAMKLRASLPIRDAT